MKTFLLSLLVVFFASFASATNDLDKELTKYYSSNKITGKNEKVSDYTLARRLYIDLAGRIPTTAELKAFVTYKSPVKTTQLVDKLLFSEDYVNNFYNLFADMLRVRPERLSDGVALLKSFPYIQYIRDNLREDKPYDVWVSEMLTATGKFTDNPATGYYLRDNGMGLDNLATTVQIFIGKDIACAQCHDDPFQDYTQKQFYQLYAFLGQQDTRTTRKDYKTILDKVDSEIREITKKDRIDNGVRQLLSANLFSISFNPAKTVRLPHDYKYDDAKPNDVMGAISLDGKIRSDSKSDNRIAFAKWVTTQDDFSYAIVNRLWAEIVGKPLISPIVNFNTKDYAEGAIVEFLGKYLRDNNYSLKRVIRLIVESDFYTRSSYTGPIESYKNQSLLVKRMSPYQVWDSVLTLVLSDPNYTRINFSEYSKKVNIEWETVSGQKLLDQMKSISAYERGFSDKFLKYKGIDLVRSAYLLTRNNFVGTFLKEFGSSDRILIDNSNNEGSITQILVLMNSPLQGLISAKESQLIQSYEREGKQKDIIFISMMGRTPTFEERSIIDRTPVEDLVWILSNTREFLFRS